MFKQIWLMTTGLSILCASLTCLAIQTTLDFQNPKQAQTKQNAPIPPAEFLNDVKTTNAQRHNQFKQQLNQKTNALSRPTIPTLSQVQSLAQTPPPANLSDSELQSTSKAAPKKEAKPPILQNPSTPSSTEPLNQGGGAVQPPIETTPAQTPTAQKPTTSQPYTGFPAPAAQTGRGTEPKNSGGFNIQY